MDCFGIFILELFATTILGQCSYALPTPSWMNILPENRVQYRPGDILIGAAMQVSFFNSEGECEAESSAIHIVETMNMIIDKVNANDSILPGVILGTKMIDTCSSESHALQHTITKLLADVLQGQNCTNCDERSLLAGIVGASLSSVSMQLARILQVFSIPQISYWSTSVELSDKNRFKYFFRSVASDIHQVNALVSFIKEMKWNYVSIVYDDDSYGLDGHSEFVRLTKEHDICIAYSKSLVRNSPESYIDGVVLDLVSKNKSRAVVVFTLGSNAEKILMSANRIPGAHSFVWIGVDGWTNSIPRDHTNGKFLDTLDGVIGFVPKLNSPQNFTEYMLNLTLEDNYKENNTRNPWFPEYISRRKNCTLSEVANSSGLRKCFANESIDRSTFRVYESMLKPMADAVYAFVYALDAYHKDKCGGERGLCQKMKNMAGTAQLASELFYYLKRVSFIGFGNRKFYFDSNHDGPPVYEMLTFSKSQVVGKSENFLDGWVKVGVYQDEKLSWYIEQPEKVASAQSSCSAPCGRGEARIEGNPKCCWYCQKCGPDQYVLNETRCEPCEAGYKRNEEIDGCTPLPVIFLEHDSPHSIFTLSIGTIGLLCTTIVTVIFIKYRNTAIVRASGKELCFFVLFGIFFTLINCFTVTLYPTEVSCATTRVILAIGPSCMYVGLLMKTIRVVFIFQSKSIMTAKTKRYLQPIEFTLLTVGVASLQIFVLIVWFVVEKPAIELVVLKDSVFKTCEILVNVQILFGLIYPFLIIITCTVLATINRNVPTGFRETFFIGFAMYTTCIIWLTFLPIFSTNSTDVPLKLATVSAALSFSAITVLLCLFFPRCHVILFNPQMNTSESVMSRSRPSDSSAGGEPAQQGNITELPNVPTLPNSGSS